MKKTLKILFPVCLLVGPACAERILDPFEASFDWVDAPQLPKPLSGFGAAVFRDRIYVAGGWEQQTISSKTVYRFDGDLVAWDTVADLPTGMAELDLVVAADTLFAVGGIGSLSDHPLRRLWAYDAEADQWGQRPSIPDEREGHAVFALNGKIFLVGGPVNEGSTHGPRVPGDSVLEYDVLNSQWTYRNPILTPRFGVVGAWAAERFLVVGGMEMVTRLAETAVVEAYDPVDDSWSAVTEDPRPSFQPAVGALGGAIHLIGGGGFPVGSSTHRVFNVEAGTWDIRREIWAPTAEAQVVVYRGEIYLIGGRVVRSIIDRVLVYRPNS